MFTMYLKEKFIQFENSHLVSNHGRIYSMKRKKFLHPYAKSKYLMFQKRVGSKQVNFPIHRLVAKFFVDGYAPGLEVNHKDGNSLNNHFKNLEWISHSQNIQHAVALHLINYKSGGKHHLSRSTRQLTKNKQLIKNWPCLSEAARSLNIPVSNIIRVCKKNQDQHKKYTAGGFVWVYI